MKAENVYGGFYPFVTIIKNMLRTTRTPSTKLYSCEWNLVGDLLVMHVSLFCQPHLHVQCTCDPVRQMQTQYNENEQVWDNMQYRKKIHHSVVTQAFKTFNIIASWIPYHWAKGNCGSLTNISFQVLSTGVIW